MRILIVGIIAVAMIVFLYISFKKCYEYMNNRVVVYLSREQTSVFLLQDDDGYIASMSIPDLYARNVKSHKEYREKVGASTLDFTESQKVILDLATEKASDFLKYIESPYIDNALMSKIGWKFALTIDGIYEDGYPHTRKDAIFVSPSLLASSDLTQTLVHEKIHIYQRKHIDLFQNSLLSNGYRVVDERKNIQNVRSNPDLDEYVYQNPKGERMVLVYASGTPKNIMDTSQKDGRIEHPFEELAYTISQQ